MAEESKEQKSAGGGQSGIVKLVVAGVLILGAAGGGFATYKLVIAKMLTVPEVEEEHAADPGEYIPEAPVMVDLPENFVNVIMEEPGIPASTLMYAVTFECNNESTAHVVEGHQQRFVDLVSKLHDSRMRSELDDIKLVKSSIQAELKQKANDLLHRLPGEHEEELMITNVFHRTMVVDDKL